ncbi:uncharacterized protein LOC110856611 [Folsomia candida]|uniref:Uncharacterized protein n=1 Tax=Folsomia candida TaxID=158441 RepID=A0A226DK74_FOLCA|nr:uncharacterized protein LOC110856611 [Folsomia candida]OXA45952.1 hypothetical protein Fcan01_19277 [Folsomia candida]
MSQAQLLSVPRPPAEVKRTAVGSTRNPETLFRHFVREYSECGISLKAAACCVAILEILFFACIMLTTSYFYIFGERHARLNAIVIEKEKNSVSTISEGLVIFGFVVAVILGLIHLRLLTGIYQANFEAITGCWAAMVAFFIAFFGFMILAHINEGKNLHIPKEEVFITLSSFYAIWLVGCFRVEMKVKMEAKKSNNADNLDTLRMIELILLN